MQAIGPRPGMGHEVIEKYFNEKQQRMLAKKIGKVGIDLITYFLIISN